MIDLVLAGEAFKLPSNWQEVPQKRLPSILEAVFVKPENGETYHELLRLVLGLSTATWARFCYYYLGSHLPEETRQENAEKLHTVLEAISWMWLDDMTVKPFVSVVSKRSELLLFDEGFETMSYGELSDGYIHLQAFARQLVEGDERLDLLVATVCRPRRTDNDYAAREDWDGDHRQPYNPHAVKELAKEVKHLDNATKVAIMVYFAGTVKQVFGDYEIMDTGIAGAGEEEYPGQALLKNQHLLAEKGIFGNINQTRAANVHDVLLFLEEHKKDLAAQLAAQKQQEA